MGNMFMSLMVLIGAFFLLAAILAGHKMKHNIPVALLRRWRLITILMLFFLTGYLLLVVILALGIPIPSELITCPVFLGGAIFVYIVIKLTQETIRRIRRAEEDLRQDSERTHFLLELHMQAPHLTEKEINDHVIEKAVSFTGSIIGFLHYINEDQRTIALTTWSREALKKCTASYDTHYPLDKAGVWADCVRLRRPVICNDYQALPDKKGYPQGHSHIARFVSLPVMEGNTVRMIIGVANKPSAYDEDDVARLQLIANDLINIIIRRRAAMELRNVKSYLLNIINSMPSILVGTDLKGTVTQWNKGAEHSTGIPSEEATGKAIEAVLPAFSERIRVLHSKIAKSRGSVEEKLTLTQNGERRFYSMMLYPLVANGMDGVVVRIEDVSERTRMQELMVQTEKMMSVGGLAVGMAHEINNPLGIISQAAQNIERRFSSQLQTNRNVAEELGVGMDQLSLYVQRRQIPEFIRSIREAVARAAKIVSSMLQFGRQSSRELRPTSLSALMDQVVELAASDYDLKKKYDFLNVEIVREYQPDVPEVPVVKVEIEQVILNLVKNAAQAMVADPRTKKPRITLRLRCGEKHAVMEVEDNGPGMDESILRRVFEPFFTTKEVGVGTGLGLSVSYMIVTENHGGSLSVESSPGNGARFIIRLPLKQSA